MSVITKVLNIDLLREGDIIFTAAPYELYRKVAASTGSKTSHVGIVLKDANGLWGVAESKVPLAQFTPIEQFISHKRTEDGWFELYRLNQSLSDTQISLLKNNADKHYGKIYDLWFRFESNSMFCSKFVYRIYNDALGIHVGRIETYESLLSQCRDIPLWFWRLWFLGRIPWKKLTITPASQINSQNLIFICGSHRLSEAHYDK